MYTGVHKDSATNSNEFDAYTITRVPIEVYLNDSMDCSDAPAVKRVRVRQDCPYCGVSFGKSSFYEHIVACSHKDDSDSTFEIPSDEDPDPPPERTEGTRQDYALH